MVKKTISVKIVWNLIARLFLSIIMEFSTKILFRFFFLYQSHTWYIIMTVNCLQVGNVDWSLCVFNVCCSYVKISLILILKYNWEVISEAWLLITWVVHILLSHHDRWFDVEYSFVLLLLCSVLYSFEYLLNCNSLNLL